MLRLAGAARSFPGPPEVRALTGVDLEVAGGEFVAIEGPSGGGKSTLLNVLGLLDSVDSGRYEIAGRDVAGLDDDALAELRSDTFGFVFQSFHLLERRSVLDSVGLGLLYRAVPRALREERSRAALERLGIGPLATTPAHLLSGGERQRVALARALASGSPVLIADEPTGNLDSANSSVVVDAIRGLHESGVTVVLVTHASEVAGAARRRVRIRDGSVVAAQESSAISEPAVPGVPIRPPGRPARIRARDLLADAVVGLIARRTRTAGLAVAVAVAVGLAVASAGIATSSRAQVSATFDAHANREVTAQWEPTAQEDAPFAAIAGLAGVERVAVLDDLGPHAVGGLLTRPALAVSVFQTGQTLPAASGLTLEEGWPDPQGGAWVGRNLEGQLGVRLEPGSAIVVDGRAVEVAGVIDDSSRIPELVGAVVLIGGDETLQGMLRRVALVTTSSGAAQQVAGQLAVAIDPIAPTSVEVFAPVDPSTLRAEVEADVLVTLGAFSGVAVLASILALANSMMMTVLERQAELGLRRAVGARRRHVSLLILTESAALGAVGGGLGLFAGLLAIIGITLANRWAPVFDPAIAPLALLGGVVVGALGGGAAAVRASRIQPGQALRL